MPSKTSLSLSNLRGFVIVIVVAFHGALAYIAAMPATNAPFSEPPYWWQTFPIIDARRWFGFDMFCAWQDISLMSVMFLLSGLFVPASLQRKGTRSYARERLWRIGTPFVLAIVVLAPLAFYPAYLSRTPGGSVAGFIDEWLALPFWPVGPQWFLWQLLALNLLAAGIFALAPRAPQRLAAIGAWAGAHPVGFVGGVTALSLLTYAPVAFAFSPWTWTAVGPLSFQICRPAHYAIYFLAGAALGAHGLDRGLLCAEHPLTRRWWLLLAAALACFGLWGGITSLTMPDWDAAPPLARLAASLAFPPACAAGSFALLAIFLRFGSLVRSRLIDSLSVNAYSIYLLHYVPVVWLQYALRDADWPAVVKWLLVLAGALIASWSLSVGFAATMARQPARIHPRPLAAQRKWGALATHR